MNTEHLDKINRLIRLVEFKNKPVYFIDQDQYTAEAILSFLNYLINSKDSINSGNMEICNQLWKQSKE